VSVVPAPTDAACEMDGFDAPATQRMAAPDACTITPPSTPVIPTTCCVVSLPRRSPAKRDRSATAARERVDVAQPLLHEERPAAEVLGPPEMTKFNAEARALNGGMTRPLGSGTWNTR